MKVKDSAVVLCLLLLLANCGPELYSKKELRNQNIPTALQNTTWSLARIYNEKNSDSSAGEVNYSKGTEDCPFTFQFRDKGELMMSFKEHTFTGIYLVSGYNFKLIYSGYREKVVWTINPECHTTPTELGYVLNWGEFDFEIQGQQLTLKSKSGYVLVMTSDI